MRSLFNLILILPLVSLVCQTNADEPAPVNYADREEVKAFVKELATEADFNERDLLSVLSHARYKQNIIDAISRPAERTLNWAEYQDIFLTERRVREGIAFMHDNKDALQKAYEIYGVPPVIVTAIIGVETMYGRIAGNFRVLDALATLGFDYPPRAKFFRRELKEFILLAREEKQMITELKGSYAGAMGLGQFIPSSYRAYAIDFDGDGFRDIWGNPTDAVGSVANYLSKHGWRRDEAITRMIDGASLPGDIFNVSLKPSKSVAELLTLGLSNEELFSESTAMEGLSRDGNTRVSPMRLTGKDGDEYWIGLQNFYVITRYNHSKLYAMAVYQLSEKLRLGSSAVVSR